MKKIKVTKNIKNYKESNKSSKMRDIDKANLQMSLKDESNAEY